MKNFLDYFIQASHPVQFWLGFTVGFGATGAILAPNLLASLILLGIPIGVNYLFYKKNITSFKDLLNAIN